MLQMLLKYEQTPSDVCFCKGKLQQTSLLICLPFVAAGSALLGTVILGSVEVKGPCLQGHLAPFSVMTCCVVAKAI